jgi:hypothetical protein
MTYPGWVLATALADTLEGFGPAGFPAAGLLKNEDRDGLATPGMAVFCAAPRAPAAGTSAALEPVIATMLLAPAPGFLTHFNLREKQGSAGDCQKLAGSSSDSLCRVTASNHKD